MSRKITLLVAVLFSLSASAQVVVNEYSASNLNLFLDSYQKTEDWIELHNTSADAFDLSGYHLSDKEDKPSKWAFPEGTMIPGGGYLIAYCSGRDVVANGEYHTSFKLSQTSGKDLIVFADPDENILEAYAMSITLTDHSNGRVSDGDMSWGVFTSPTPGASNGETSYARYTAAPTMDKEAGYYTDNVLVSITNNEPNSVLRYTTDGTNVVQSSPMYTAPIAVTKTSVIKARSFSNDATVLTGKMEFNTYLINEDYTLAVFSVAADDVIELANGAGELIPIGSIEYFNTNKELEAKSFGSLNRHGQDSWVLDHRSIDWISRDEMGYSKAVEAPLFSFSDRDEYQKFMFRNSGDDNYPAIAGPDHEGSTHIRDEFVQTLSQEGGMELDTRAVERVVLFLNGEFWGVYGMRDRPVDHDYTSEYYDQGKYEIQYLSTWGDTEIEYGGIAAINDWIEFRNFVLTNDMSLPENYQRVDDELNTTSLIDYMVANLTVVASDWLNYNTGWWRGLNPDGDHKKWGYILWDLDATFDYYRNYTGVPNISPTARACDLEDISDFMDNFFQNTEIVAGGGGHTGGGHTGGGMPLDSVDCASVANGSSPYPNTDSLFILTVGIDEFCCNQWDGICQGIYDNLAGGGGGGGGFGNNWPGAQGDVGRHEKIFLKLLEENAEFRQLYYSRYADLLNTVYSCENMNETLDRMLDVIRPEMPAQIARWGGSMNEWENNVTRLKNFINQRCTMVDDGMIDCYEELSGPYNVTLMTEPNGVGEIDFNTLDIESFPWSGDYFGGMANKIKAKTFKDFEDDYEFSHWVSANGNVIFPDDQSRKAELTLTGPDTLTAVFELLTSVDELADIHDVNVYPNPARDHLVVDFNLETAADVQVTLSNVMGAQISVLENRRRGNGNQQAVFDLSQIDYASGLYLLSLKINNQETTFKVSLIK